MAIGGHQQRLITRIGEISSFVLERVVVLGAATTREFRSVNLNVASSVHNGSSGSGTDLLAARLLRI